MKSRPLIGSSDGWWPPSSSSILTFPSLIEQNVERAKTKASGTRTRNRSSLVYLSSSMLVQET